LEQKVQKPLADASLMLNICWRLSMPVHKRTIVQKKKFHSAVPKIEFTKFTLANGLQVIFHVDRKLPMVHVNHWFHVGSKNERPGRTGLAHLFEHLMFQGSVNAKGEYFAHVERAGANLREGGVNGTTGEDRTNYFVTVPSANLDYILWLESDRIATLPEALTQVELDNQREVVRNERRQGLENQPYGRAFKLLSENLFPAGHPYSWPVIGSHEDLVAASMDDVKQFFNTYYTPNNLSLCIAGDFDTEEARRLVERYYGVLKAGPALDRPQKFVPSLSSQKVVEVRDRVPQGRVYLAWPAPEYFSADEPDLALGSSILSDGLSSRLSKKLVYDLKLCSNVSSFNDASEIAGLFAVVATVRPGADCSIVEQIIAHEIGLLAQKGPTSRELARAKTKWEYDFISGLERIGGFGGKADRLNADNTYLGNPDKFGVDLDRFRAVTAQSLKESVDRWINSTRHLVVRFRPEQSGRGSSTTLDRSTVPLLGKDKAFAIPEILTGRLENGLQVYVVERHELPKVSVVLGTRGGSIMDPSDKGGVAQLVVQTIDRGTRTRKSLEIEEELGDLGTELHGLAAREFSYLSIDVLKQNLTSAISVLSDVVLHPLFPMTEFERERSLHLDALNQENNNPSALAGRIRPMLAFGRNHLYGRPSKGLPSSIQSITRNDLMEFHKNCWTANDAGLIFVGDISLAEAMRLAKKEFGSWHSNGRTRPEISATVQVEHGTTYLVDRQDSAQTIISQILPGPSRMTPEYYSLKLADAVWGGGFMTRLNLNLREDKGYTYGVFSTLALFRSAGYWFAGGSVETDKTKEAVVEFVKELRNLAGDKPITSEELAEAKANRIRGFAQQYESLGRVAGQIAEIWSYGLPLNEHRTELSEIANAEIETVNRLARKYADPSKSMMLLVGDLTKIEQPIRDLNLGPVVVLDLEGNRIR
jgi:zinc protease